MWKILFSSANEEMIVRYIDLYREYFLDIFHDTWIWSESLIRSRYIEAVNSLQADIRETIVHGLSRDVIWYTAIDSEMKSVVFHSGKRNISIEYSEDMETRTWYIWFIRIHRKK